jgi:hypothetical protein
VKATTDRRTWRGPLIAFAAALVLYVASTSPVVFWGDSAELSCRAVDLELSPIARGYPMHRLLTWAAGRAFHDPAFGSNLVSAFFGAVSVGLVYEAGRRLGGRERAGVAAAVVTGLAHTFWMYSAVAEVYTLHTALMLGAILLAIVADSGGARTRVALGVVLGLALLHHRMIAFTVPGLVLWTWTGTPAKDRLRAIGQVTAGALVGAIPFIVLCVVASRTPPADVSNRAWWWFQDVFMGGERNAGFLLGEGRKGLAKSAAYLGRWLVFNLPGPALALAVAGFVVAGRRTAWFLGVLAVCNVWFPLRYDWTGDQYTFLIPLYPILALAAAVAVGRIEETRGARAAVAATAACAAAPLLLYGALGFTSLGSRFLPGLTPETVRSTIVPVRGGDRAPREWCVRRLESLPPGARLHCDWGDGEAYLYLQRAEGIRRDVTVDVWNTTIKLGDGGGEEWLSVLPFTRETPKPVAAVLPRLERRGDGLFRVLPPSK